MILLGIESATELAGVAVGDGDRTRAAAYVTGLRRHGETLAPMTAHVLAQAELSLADVEVVAVDIGPGLFTGLRVGIATAKGFAQGVGIGMVGITSLQLLAFGAFDAGWPGPVVAVVDGRRGEVFAATYRRGPGPEPVEESPPRRFSPEGLRDRLASRSPGPDPILAAGDGARRYGDLLSGAHGVHIAGPSLVGPSPAALVALASHRLATGAEPVGPSAIRPLYLREADAAINWAERRQAPG